MPKIPAPGRISSVPRYGASNSKRGLVGIETCEEPILQSQRDCIVQPRVARNELPWGCWAGALNPERVLTEWSRNRTNWLWPMALVVLFLMNAQASGKSSI